MNCRECSTMGFLGSRCPNCDAGPEYCDETDRPTTTRAPHRDLYKAPACTYAAPDTKLAYKFIARKSEKAVLFAFSDNRGVYQQWVPLSVITELTEKHVTLKSWFARRFA